MMIKFNTIFNVYILSFFAVYFSTYPLRVYMQNQNVSIMYILLSILTPILIISYLLHAKNNFSLSFKKNNLIISSLVLFILLLYFINTIIYPQSSILYLTFRKYISYSVLFLVILNINYNFRITSLKTIQWLFFTLSLITFLAVVYNSLFWSIPEGVELLPKYFIGPLIRAGGGYLDPNFLSINIISLLFLTFIYIENKLLKVISITILIISYFLTFSRAAIVFGTFILVLYLLKNNKKALKSFVFFLAVISFVTYWIISHYDLFFLFERFTNAEGSSSTDDRLYQYVSFIHFLYENFNISNIFLGFGGLDNFMELYGVALHSYWLNLILDIGLIAPVIIILVWLYFFYNTQNLIARYLLIYWLLQISFLPNLPDTLYLILIISLLKSRKTYEKSSLLNPTATISTK